MRRRAKISGLQRWLLPSLILLAAIGAPPVRADEVYRAERVKAAFLYRFAAYIDWPADALSEPFFTITVLDDDAVATELAAILPDHPIKNLPSNVRAIHSINEVADIRMLYVGPSWSGDLRALIDNMTRRSVLVVTDHERALDEGSTINFRLVDRRLRFEVSLPAAYRAGLKIEPALLTVAARVRSGPQSELACAPSFGFLSALDPPCLMQAAR